MDPGSNPFFGEKSCCLLGAFMYFQKSLLHSLSCYAWNFFCIVCFFVCFMSCIYFWQWRLFIEEWLLWCCTEWKRKVGRRRVILTRRAPVRVRVNKLSPPEQPCLSICLVGFVGFSPSPSDVSETSWKQTVRYTLKKNYGIIWEFFPNGSPIHTW